MWLAPVQATIVPVADRHLAYAAEVAGVLEEAGLRVELDETGETVGEKIRRALVDKHPAVLVVGDRDVENQTVGLRYYGDESEQRGMAVADATAALVEAARPPR
jgi:threonyl-tRNA synthetase